MGSSTLKILGLFIVFVAVISLTTFSVFSDSSGGVSESRVREIIKEEIAANPDLILQSVSNHQQRQQAQQQGDAALKLAEHKDWLENDPTSPIEGNLDSDVTVVEFFDYHCGYCKRSLPNVVKLLDSDKNIKFVFKEFPILGEDSVIASKVALAVHLIAPDKYFDYHKEVMEKRISGKDAHVKAATDLGLDKAAIEEKMESAEVKSIIDRNRELANIAGIRGTPAFVINGELIPGAIDYDEMVRRIEAARNELQN